MKTVIAFFTEPFTKNLHHFISIFVLISIYDLMYFYFDLGYRDHVLSLFAHLILLAYFSVAFCSLLPHQLKKIYLIFIYLLSSIYFLMGTFSYLSMQINPRSSIVTAILGTNPQEASEFVSTFINAKVILSLIGIPLLLIFFSKWIKKHQKGYKIRLSIGFPLIAICAALFLHRPSVWLDGIASVYYFVLFKYDRCPELAQFATQPRLLRQGPQPKNVVIIIGESEAKSHCSLYGYNLPTNPKLEQLRNDSLLFVYSNVTSPEVLTVDVFKYLLNTFHPEDKSKSKWYESTTLFDVARQSGYKSAWLSNQTKNGMWDNLVGNISELSDTSVFVGNRYYILDREWYDGELIPVTNSLVSKQGDQSLALTIIHLMGSHEQFEKRYPSDYEHFHASDYQDYPEKQRDIRAKYDNSVLYNDFVVSELINIYSDKESIVFYFSDHGLDIFDSDPNHFGHAKPTAESREICMQIPFMVYTSPLFQEHFPIITKRIKENYNKSFRTDNLIYAVMDVAGLSFKDNDDVKKNSLFSTP